jgi:hypothetical protein
VDTTEPSAFARGILNVMPYAFLDDAPLEERRTQAVMNRRTLDAKNVDVLGALDPDAVARVKEEAWPTPENVEEVHEALQWMGYVTEREAQESGWTAWLDELQAAGRIFQQGERIFAADATLDPKTVFKGRLEALGPISNPTRRKPTFSSSSKPKGTSCAAGSPATTRGASAACSRASTATRSSVSAARSSPSPRKSSGASSPAGSTPTRLQARRRSRTARGRPQARRLRGSRGDVGACAPSRAPHRLPP